MVLTYKQNLIKI